MIVSIIEKRGEGGRDRRKERVGWWEQEGRGVGEGLSWEAYEAEKKGLRQMASSSYDSQYYIEKSGEGGMEGVLFVERY